MPPPPIPIRCVTSRQQLCAAVSQGTQVVDFFNRWHLPPPERLARVDQLRRLLGSRSPLLLVDLDAAPDLSVALGIEVLPHLLVFRGGRRVARCTGSLPSLQAASLLSKRVLESHTELSCHFVREDLHTVSTFKEPPCRS